MSKAGFTYKRGDWELLWVSPGSRWQATLCELLQLLQALRVVTRCKSELPDVVANIGQISV